MIKNNTIPKRLNIKWRKDGEDKDYIIYKHPVSGMLDIINPVASTIFENCTGDKTVEQIAELVTELFAGVTKEIAINDTKQFIEHMVREDLMIIIND